MEHPVSQPVEQPVSQPVEQLLVPVFEQHIGPTQPKLDRAISTTDERPKPRGVMRTIVYPSAHQVGPE